MLWLTAEPPHFTLSGGSIRQAHLIAGVAERADVHLRLVGELEDDRVRDLCATVREVPWTLTKGWLPRTRQIGRFLTPTGHPDHVHAARHRRRVLEPWAADAADHQVVNVEHIELGPLHNGAPTRWVLDLHNLLSVRARQQELVTASTKGRFFWRVEHRRARRLERQLATTFDDVVVCSPEDADVLVSSPHVVGNGVDVSAFRPTPLPRDPVVVMTAHLAYFPNVDAVEWLTDVAPLVREQIPDVRFVIVGRTPHPRVEAACRRAGFELHPDVESVVPFLEQARAAVVPVRVGSGTRLKALEAMAAGRPVVGTTIGLEGLGVVPGTHALVGDGTQELANALVSALGDDDIATELARAGRDLAVQFDWTALARRYASVVLGDPAAARRAAAA